MVYTMGSIYALLPRLGIRLKTPRLRIVPRTRHVLAWPDGKRLHGWTAQVVPLRPARTACYFTTVVLKIGEHLAAVGLKAGQGIVWGDEMRVGLRGQVRKVWVPRGVPVSQALKIGWSYIYGVVALDPRTGRLWWQWQQNMKGEEVARIWRAWAVEPGIDGWVWDGAGATWGRTCRPSRRRWNQF